MLGRRWIRRNKAALITDGAQVYRLLIREKLSEDKSDFPSFLSLSYAIPTAEKVDVMLSAVRNQGSVRCAD